MTTPAEIPGKTEGAASTPPADAHVRAEGLAVTYGAKHALKDVSLGIPRGALTAIIGPSGCGKTSFLTCINRLTDLIPGSQVSGKVYLDGRDIRGPGVDVVNLRRRVGMIFQKPNPFPVSIRRNIELPLRDHGVRSRPDLDRRVEQALTDVGLWKETRDRLDSPAHSLSGGQQQRLCLARAMALQPEVLLMDEPCSALDPISSGVVEDLIAGLRGRYTVVIVTHNLAQARRIADRVAVFWMQDGTGRLIEEGPVRQIFESPRDPQTGAYINGTRG